MKIILLTYVLLDPNLLFFLRTMSLHWFLINYYALVVLVVIFSYTNLYGCKHIFWKLLILREFLNYSSQFLCGKMVLTT